MLNPAFLVVREISAIGNDKVVEEEYAHQFARFLHACGQSVVVTTGARVVAWVVVAKGKNGGIVQYGVFHYHPYIHGCLAYSAM